MEFGLAASILQKIRNVLMKYTQIERAVIYGSRATGEYKSYSDIDIAVYAPKMSFEEFGRLRFELNELPIIFKMDIVHIDSLGNKALKEKIGREGIDLFPNQNVVR